MLAVLHAVAAAVGYTYVPPYTLWLHVPNTAGEVLPDGIEKSEMSAACGAVPVHCRVTGGLQSTAVEPPVAVVAAPPV